MRFRSRRDVFSPAFTLATLAVLYDGPRAFTLEHGWTEAGARGPLPFGFVCEDPDRGLELGGDGKGKIPGETAIPPGEYRVTVEHQTTRGWVLRLHDVPFFRGILVHPGNTPKDTKGCQLPGLRRDVEKGSVLGSRAARDWLVARTQECLGWGEPVWWVVERDPVAWAAYGV